MKLGSIPWAATFDWKHGSGQDLLDPSLQELLISAAEAHCFCAAGLAPTCASFSAAITPPVRTSQHPSGIPLLSPAMALKVSQGNAHCSFVVRFVRVLLKLGVPFWLENPDCSWLWRQPEFLALLEDFPHRAFWKYDCCRFGSPWRKRTRVLTTTELAGSTTLCNGGHEHLILRGRSRRHKMSWTAVAESYPPGVCRTLAAAGACVRDQKKRLGEADRPGPPRRRPARAGSLFDIELVERTAIRVRMDIWDTFKAWLREELSESAVLALFSCAPLLALVLRDYADVLYKTGASLGSYRQLLAHSQRLMPILKPHLRPAWDMVSRWEEVEPVCQDAVAGDRLSGHGRHCVNTSLETLGCCCGCSLLRCLEAWRAFARSKATRFNAW